MATFSDLDIWPSTRENLDGLDMSTVELLDISEEPTRDAEKPQAIEQAAVSMQAFVSKHAARLTAGFVPKEARGWSKKKPTIQQALAASIAPMNTSIGPAHSHQISLEDLVGAWQFVPPPQNIMFEAIERTIFQENHIAGQCLSLIALATVKRGVTEERYSPDDAQTPQEKAEDQREVEGLRDWWRQIHPHMPARMMIQRSAAIYRATGNLYWEIVRTEPSPASYRSPPKWIMPAVTSSMRVLAGHRGYVQYTGQQFTWYNPYTPAESDRQKGVDLWTQYWASRGVDVEDAEFIASSWAVSLSSKMPEGTYNPYLTEIQHFADLSLDSQYYGWPRDYRIQKLSMLLDAALDYNISYQINNEMLPYIIVMHGELDNAAKNDIRAHLRDYRGSRGFGKVPVVTAQPLGMSALNGGSVVKGGIEVVHLGAEKREGMFLALMDMVLTHLAMHYNVPKALLTPQNANRAVALAAEAQLDDQVVNDLQETFEGALERITRDDMGYSQRRIGFHNLDMDDKMLEAQIAALFLDHGVVNSNWVRTKLLNEPPRGPNGDRYYIGGRSTFEDQLPAPLSPDAPGPPPSIDTPIEQRSLLDRLLKRTLAQAEPKTDEETQAEIDAWQHDIDEYFNTQWGEE